MKKKSAAFYRYCQDLANDQLSYYDTVEIEEAVYDLLDMNMIEDAEHLAEEGRNMHPNDETVEKLLIWIYLHHHRMEEAEKLFQKYSNDGSDWTSKMQFAICVMHGHPQMALADFFPLLQDGKIPAIDWITAIDEMFEALPMKVLSPYLVKAIDYCGNNAESLGRIGAMLIDAHLFDKAAIALEKSLDLDAYDIFSWQDLARCYLLIQETDKCIEACDYGLAIDEKNPLLSFIRGYLHYEQQEFAECIPFLANARKFAEGKIEVRNLNMTDEEIQQQINVTYEMLGISYMETEQFDQSMECYQILSERNPDNPMPFVQLASLYLLKGDLNLAKAKIERALEIEPNSEATRSLYVSILTSMHDFDNALKALKQLIRLHPRKTSYLVAYAELCMHIGKDKEADAAYRKVLKKGVNDPSLRILLKNYFSNIGDSDALKRLEEMGISKENEEE